jgi:hypothetical protein
VPLAIKKANKIEKESVLGSKIAVITLSITDVTILI